LRGPAARTLLNKAHSRLNKCIYLSDSISWGAGGEVKLIDLVDLQENRQIAFYLKIPGVLRCLVQQQQCKSEEEWRALIKPFMED
jgi:HD superfamily phosphohydrolase YqeK